MKKSSLLAATFFFLLSVLSFFSCHKESKPPVPTIVEGTVRDIVTDSLIAGVFVLYNVIHKNSGSYGSEARSTNTNGQGYFKITETDGLELYIVEFYKEGYMPNINLNGKFKIELGTQNTFEVFLTPD